MIPQGWRVGHIGEIEIRVDISLLLITLIIAYALGAGVLPYAAPGLSATAYFLTALVASVFFIGSILWHEMAHATLALQYRIPVVRIVLYLFGGMAQIARDPERPIQEFWIAIVGPLSSMFLAVCFEILSILFRPNSLPGAALGWLASVNLTLALFNLLPGFPLDGGRILRSILWKFGGSYRKSTRQASRVGQVMAGLFVLLGILMIFSGISFDGIWFILIAAFMYFAATSTYRGAKGGLVPDSTPVRKVMRYNVPIIEPGLPLALLAWKYMDHAPDQAYPVMENDALLGIVSAVEVDKIPRLDWGKIRVEETMLPRAKLCIVAADDDLQSALAALDAAGLNHAPVFQDGQLVGMLNRRDIVYRT